jgi:hypothetical protein
MSLMIKLLQVKKDQTTSKGDKCNTSKHNKIVFL